MHQHLLDHIPESMVDRSEANTARNAGIGCPETECDPLDALPCCVLCHEPTDDGRCDNCHTRCDVCRKLLWLDATYESPFLDADPVCADCLFLGRVPGYRSADLHKNRIRLGVRS